MQLWGGGGSPFKPTSDGNCQDRSGTKVEIMADLRPILEEVKTDPKWKETKVAVASSCDEPSWARECIQLIQINSNIKLKNIFDPNLTEIYKSPKSVHLKEISKKSGIDLKDMMFFDNEWGRFECRCKQYSVNIILSCFIGNCQTVAKVGVSVVYTPKGVTRSLFEEAMTKFPFPGQIIGKRRR